MDRCSTIMAVEIGKDLVKKHFIHPVFGDHKFEYSNQVYRFLEHEPYISKCYNFRGSIDEMNPQSASDITRKLSKIMSAILESYASEDRRFLDYTSISNSEEFRRYLNVVHGLQRVDISSLSPNEKLAFFLNLYNSMAALDSVNPLIHFGLCDATRSGPMVRFFNAENVEAELRASTREFFSNGGIQVDLAKRTVHLTSIIKW
ncbi:hypothetical protein V2J09_024116 [Rumex salicifolius]